MQLNISMCVYPRHLNYIHVHVIYVEHYNNVLVYTNVHRSLPLVMVHAYRVRKIQMEELLTL